MSASAVSPDQTKPGQLLLSVIVTLLTPLFLGAAGNDLALAHAAALETVNEYRARSGVELLIVAQIVAFSLAALATALKSMQDDLSAEAMLRLQTKANALSRTAEQNRRALDKARNEPPPLLDDLPDEAELLASLAERAANRASPNPTKTAPTETAPIETAPAEPAPAPAEATIAATGWTEQQVRAAWAAGFAEVAQEIAGDLENLSPAQRRAATIQMSALNDAAHSLQNGEPLERPTL